jgi:hypothetical protein
MKATLLVSVSYFEVSEHSMIGDRANAVDKVDINL